MSESAKDAGHYPVEYNKQITIEVFIRVIEASVRRDLFDHLDNGLAAGCYFEGVKMRNRLNGH